MKVEVITPAEGDLCAVGESPVWRAEEAALYWVDITGKRIHRWSLDSRLTPRVWHTPEMVACIAFDAEGTLLAGMESGIFALQLRDDGRVEPRRLASVAHPLTNMRFNDGRCDRQGRFVAGTMHMDGPAAHRVGTLFQYDAARGLRSLGIGQLLTQNGLAWSPDGARMYLSDSHALARTIWAYEYDQATGTPHSPRVFVDMNQYPGRPDGAAVDADGCYWTCANDAGLLLRFTPAGALDRQIALPVRKPAMCAFGGASFDTLFVTSIRPSNPADLVGQPLAGAVFALRPGVCGLPEPRFATPLSSIAAPPEVVR